MRLLRGNRSPVTSTRSERTSMSDGDVRHHVVVLLTGSECETYPPATCVMDALGPYTRAEAEAVFAQQPQWTCPHLMMLRCDP
jgi:hypothetical protein